MCAHLSLLPRRFSPQPWTLFLCERTYLYRAPLRSSQPDNARVRAIAQVTPTHILRSGVPTTFHSATLSIGAHRKPSFSTRRECYRTGLGGGVFYFTTIPSKGSTATCPKRAPAQAHYLARLSLFLRRFLSLFGAPPLLVRVTFARPYRLPTCTARRSIRLRRKSLTCGTAIKTHQHRLQQPVDDVMVSSVASSPRIHYELPGLITGYRRG